MPEANAAHLMTERPWLLKVCRALYHINARLKSRPYHGDGISPLAVSARNYEHRCSWHIVLAAAPRTVETAQFRYGL